MSSLRTLQRKAVIPCAVVLAAVFAAPDSMSAQGGGPAAYYSPSYTNASWERIFESHRSWGNVVPGGTRSPNGHWCVHPDYRPGHVLLVSANGTTLTCTVGDMVNQAHVAQWRSRWVIELSWTTFQALGLDRRNVVDSVQPAGVGGAGGVESASPQGQPSERHFPETGYTVQNDFLDFWRSNGGLPAFGYPLSEEIEENGRTVQYFERAVFERHAENDPPYRVLLRRLGAYAASELRGSEPFQPASDGASGGRYFEQTGFSIDDRFVGFWEGRGGLPIYGYPISRPFEQDGMLVQYFERAVFEWHPDHTPEYQVLLRHLGAQSRY